MIPDSPYNLSPTKRIAKLLAISFLFLGLFNLLPQSYAEATNEASIKQTQEASTEKGFLQEKVDKLTNWVDSLGAVGYIVFIIVYIIAALLFVPGLLLTIGAGGTFGVIKGTIIVSIASVSAAAFAFLIARYLARTTIEKKFGQNPKFAAVDSAIGQEGAKIVLLLRLTPVMPFSLGNYLYGLTKVKFWPYVFASWIGMFPGTILYVYIGYIGTTVASGQVATGKFALNIIAFAATVIVTVFVTKIARKALKESSLVDDSTNTNEASMNGETK